MVKYPTLSQTRLSPCLCTNLTTHTGCSVSLAGVSGVSLCQKGRGIFDDQDAETCIHYVSLACSTSEVLT